MSWYNDTFTEASTTALTSHTSDSGHGYSHWAGVATSPNVYSTLGGVVGAGAAGTQVYKVSTASPSADEAFTAVGYVGSTAAFTSAGICRRLNATGDGGYLAAYLPSTSKWYIFRIGAALATTQLAVSASTYSYSAADTPTLVFDVTGTGASVSLSLTVNGTSVCTATDTDPARITAAGNDGYWWNCAGAGQGLFFGSASATSSTPSTSYTITTPVARQQYRLSGVTTGNATVSLTGTYTGTAPDRWRVVQDGTSTPVTGLDWQSFSTAPSGGAFSQTITIPKQSGFVNVVVGHTTDPATATSGKVGTGPIIAVDGQSWAWLWFSATAYAGDSSLTPDAKLTITGKQASNAWLTPSAATMNAAIAAGNALIAALGCPVALVDGSWDGSGLTVTADGGQWISGGAAGNAYTSAASAHAAAGGVDATIWIQGQADAGSSVTQSAYYTALGQMTALRRTTYGATHPYVIVTHPRYLAGLTDAQVEAIRKAHVQACGDAYNYRVDAIDVPLHTDNVHPTAAGFTTLGARCAQAVLEAFGLASYSRGAQITSVSQISSTVYDVNLTHDGGTDITPSTGITGFRALVSGSPVTISSADRQSATSIRLTLASPAASAPTIDYLYGKQPTVTAVAKDNSALTLPIEYNSGVVASNAATSVTLTLTNGAGVPLPGLTGLKWAFFDQASPNLFSAPVAKGSVESTDGSGVLVLDITGTMLSPGQVGWVIVTDSDGSVSNHRAFSGPATVA